MTVVSNVLLVMVAAVLAILFAMPPDTQYLQLLITEIASYALLAIAFDVCMGFTGLLSLATALYFGLGAYFFVFGLSVLGVDVLGSTVISVMLVLSIAVPTGIVAVQLRGAAFLVATLIFVTASHALAQNWKNITGGDDGLVLVPSLFRMFNTQFTAPDRYRFGLIVFALGFFLTVAVIRSPLGRLFRSVKENEFRLDLLGYNARLIKLIAYCWAAFLASLAGAIYCVSFQHVHTGLFNWSVSANALIWAFFGGLGSVFGPLIGVSLLVPFENYISSIVGYPRLLTGVLLIIVVLVNRNGIVGLLITLSERHMTTGRHRSGDRT
jgi:branched-chain amino acid transport system permease protein